MFRILYGPARTRHRHWALVAVITCLVAPWLGYGFLFAAFALLAILAIVRPRACPRRSAIGTAAVSLVLMGVSTAVMMKMLSGGQADHEALRSFMRPWFIDVTSLYSVARAGGYMVSSASMLLFPYYRWLLIMPVTFVVGAVVWLVILFGLWVWPGRSRIAMVVWIFAAWGAVAVAAILRQYPFGAVRMMVFVAAPMTCAMTMGLIGLLRLFAGAALPASLAGKVTAIVCLAPAIYLFGLPLHNAYWVNQDYRAALKVLGGRRAEDERVFVSLDAVQSVRFYLRGENSGFDFVPVTNGTRPVPGFDYPEFVRSMLAEYGDRCWMLASGRRFEESWEMFLETARRRGYRVEMVSATGGDNGTGKAELFLLSRD